jgi:L-lactate dehydrogenase complex protein LldG
MSREQILERIRAGLADLPARDAAAEAGDGLPVVPAPQTFGDPVAMFVERAQQLTMTAEIVASVEEAAVRAAAWCAGRDVRRAAAWDTPDVRPVLDRLRAAGIEILPPGSPIDALAGADVGVTGAEWGIAETATLVLPADAQRPRLTSLLPPGHVAVLQADRILADLPALFARAGALPSALTLITGPSRSADIGFVPVLGAHGPMAVAVFVVAT